jgi:hypothetical protein
LTTSSTACANIRPCSRMLLDPKPVDAWLAREVAGTFNRDIN